MAYTPYDWQQTLRQKADYVLDRLREGSPIVGISAQEGILLFTVRRNQRKIFEIYDNLAFAGLGNPSDLEAVRQLAVDFAHAEGFQRSPQDVSIQRVVGFAISPALKRHFSDPLRLPLVLCGLFAQVGDSCGDDLFYILNYDGEFSLVKHAAVVAGAEHVAEKMKAALADLKEPPAYEAALETAMRTWAIGFWESRHEASGRKEGSRSELEAVKPPKEREWRELLAQELKGGAVVEAALLERRTRRERRFRLLSEEEIKPLLPGGRS